MEPTWPQEGSQNRSKIDENPSLGASKTQDPPRGALGKENDTKIEEKTINFDAEDMQKKASIPLCFSTVLGRKIGGTVPKKGEHSVFFLLECNAMQCNTIHYNTMQCNAMQWHSPTLEKALCHALFLAYGILGRSPCHPAAAEGAKLSRIS